MNNYRLTMLGPSADLLIRMRSIGYDDHDLRIERKNKWSAPEHWKVKGFDLMSLICVYVDRDTKGVE